LQNTLDLDYKISTYTFSLDHNNTPAGLGCRLLPGFVRMFGVHAVMLGLIWFMLINDGKRPLENNPFVKN
jgi:hypothetical protein